MIYLNEGYEGGRTELEDHVIEPEVGRGLVFCHPIRHQGAEVRTG